MVCSALPSDAQQRNNLIDQLIENEAHHRVGRGDALGTLYQQLVQKYPCISTFNDDELDECVWGDGPLIHNFGQKIAALNINRNEEKVMADKLKRHPVPKATSKRHPIPKAIFWMDANDAM